MSDERNCATCAHRYGSVRTYWQCQATGFFCSTETKCGGVCAKGGVMRLWEPRRPWYRRLIRFFIGVKA